MPSLTNVLIEQSRAHKKNVKQAVQAVHKSLKVLKHANECRCVQRPPKLCPTRRFGMCQDSEGLRPQINGTLPTLPSQFSILSSRTFCNQAAKSLPEQAAPQIMRMIPTGVVGLKIAKKSHGLPVPSIFSVKMAGIPCFQYVQTHPHGTLHSSTHCCQGTVAN